MSRNGPSPPDPSPPSQIGVSGVPGGTRGAPRSRSIKACSLCRQRRIRCDNAVPRCSACEKSDAECIRVVHDNSAPIDAGCLKILDRIDDLESILRSLTRSAPSAPNVEANILEGNGRKIIVSTEEVLSWAVFRSHYRNRCDLKALLRVAHSSTNPATSPASFDSSFLNTDLGSVATRRLVDQFFQNVHGKNPMLDETAVRQAVHRMSLDGPSWDAECCLALLICAVGALSTTFDTAQSVQSAAHSTSQSAMIAQSYFNAAQRRIGAISGAGGVIEAQCYFYSGVYLMTVFRPMKAWRCFTQALACCQEFACANQNGASDGSQISCTKLGLPEEECVYWSCWKSELELRLHLNLRDFSSHNLSYPLLFPTPPESMTHELTKSWYFYLSEISLRRLELRSRDENTSALNVPEIRVVEELSRCTTALEELAKDWLRSLPPAMSLNTPQEEDDVLKFILRGHYLNLWEIIYWPWLEVFSNERLSSHQSGLYVAKALQIAIDRIRINKPGFHHRHHGTWFMVQSCTRSALVLLAARYSSRAAVHLPEAWQEAVTDAVELLRIWRYESPDAADRLLILEELMASVH